MFQRGEQTGDARVDAVEEARLLRWRAHRRRKTLVVRVGRPRLRIVAAAVLRSLIAESDAREVRVRLAEPRTVHRRIDADRPVLVLANAAHVQLQRLPRPQSFFDLFGEDIRIAGDTVGVLRDQTGRLMVAVAIALVTLEARDHHE